MSIRIMANVWERSPHKSTVLLMQLAIADHANDEGISYPGVSYLAKKCRVGRRQAIELIRTLVEAGDISLAYMGVGRGHKKVFQTAPFYLPGSEKGVPQNIKGVGQRGKGEGQRAPSYTESLLIINNQDIENKTKHEVYWEKCCEVILPPTGSSKLKDYMLGAVVLSSEGKALRVQVADAQQKRYLEDRAKKSIERALVGIAAEALDVQFLEAR